MINKDPNNIKSCKLNTHSSNQKSKQDFFLKPSSHEGNFLIPIKQIKMVPETKNRKKKKRAVMHSIRKQENAQYSQDEYIQPYRLKYWVSTKILLETNLGVSNEKTTRHSYKKNDHYLFRILKLIYHMALLCNFFFKTFIIVYLFFIIKIVSYQSSHFCKCCKVRE